ncbi:MAG: LuxR C-terminal-related transcriptional regulator [Sporichthyaceae bacterium]|jgi:DNA-binding CsgD family transcriptional regulator
MAVEAAPRTRPVVPDGAAGRRRHAREAERRLGELLGALGEAAGLPRWSAGEHGEHLAALDGHLGDLVEAVLTRLRETGSASVRHCEFVAGVGALRRSHAERIAAERIRAMDWAQEVLAAEEPVDPHRLLQRAAEQAGRICGLDRVLIYSVEESQLTPEAVWFAGDNEEWAAEVLASARRNPVELRGQRYEIDMIRRRHAVLVTEPREDPRVWGPLLEELDNTGFLSVPVVADDTVVATLAADTHFSGRPLDTLDRDCLAAFARGLGHALERADLMARLHAQREVVRRLLRAAERSVEDLCTAEFSLAIRPAATLEAEPGTRRARATGRRSDVLPEADLTQRETQVLQLLAAGATNLDISRRLVITEGTVKSHVKGVLRKLGAANRAQAVSIYHGARAVGAD